MARHKGWDEDSDEGEGERKDGEEVGVKADEAVDGEEGKSLRGAAPEEQADGA